MRDLFIRRQTVTLALDGMKGDLELRLQVVKGDRVAVQVMGKETKEEKKEIITQHIKNLDFANALINEQFDLINELSKK